MSADQLSTAVAYWPVCMYLALWTVGGFMVVLIAALSIIGSMLLIGDVINSVRAKTFWRHGK